MDDSRGKGIPFIIHDEQKGYLLSEQAESFLNSLAETKLGVISVVGKYRTGKSFFINRVLLDEKGKGFSVGPTINPCTKGLWLWSKLLKTDNPDYEDMYSLLIDTEGFGGMDENQNHDTRIFLFSLLLSSFFIYNSSGSIDENALNNLSLIVNLAKDIQIKTGGKQSESDDVAQFFPSFLWIVRDFALKLVDQHQNSITPKEYLENALQPQKGISDSVEAKNRTRKLLKHFFRERDCATMIRPLENEKDLQRLNEMDNSELRPEFYEQMINVRKKVFKKIKPKTLNGKYLTGPMLVQLCKAYADAINSGKVPNIESAWTYMCKQESYKALQDSVRLAEDYLKKISSKPLSNEELKALKNQLKEDALNHFKKKSVGAESEISPMLEELNKKINDKINTHKEDNIKKWKGIYNNWLISKYEDLEDRAKKDEFSSFFEFEREFEKLRQDYEKENPEGPGKDICWKEFSEKVLVKAAAIITKKQEQQFQNTNRRMTARLEQTELQLLSKSKEVEEDKKNLLTKIHEVEKEKITYQTEKQMLKSKIEDATREKERIEQKYQELLQEHKLAKEKLSKVNFEEVNQLKTKLELAHTDNIRRSSEIDKKSALLEQEISFVKRENESLHRKVSSLEEDNHKLKLSKSEAERIADALRLQVNQTETSKNTEITLLKMELERKKIEASNSDAGRKSEVATSSDWLIEKGYLENQNIFLKNQLEENKRLHDSLLRALEMGIHNGGGDADTANDLVETNRHLSSVIEKMENNCKELEEKVESGKKYKKIVKNSSRLQCLHCGKAFAPPVFLQHLNECLTNPGTTGLQMSQSLTANGFGTLTGIGLGSPINNSIHYGINQSTMQLDQMTMSSPTTKLELVNRFNQYNISIVQTMIKETSDSKPYTEYLIQVVDSGKKTFVTRKYKEFCDFHQNLTLCFPTLKFPESTFAMLELFSSPNQSPTTKKPIIIEERRKAMQQYLRDLAKIDLVKNSDIFRTFLAPSNENAPDNLIAPFQSNQTDSPTILNNSRMSNRDETPKRKSTKIPLNTQLRDNGYVEENEQPQIQTKIDKNMLSISPHSFMKTWKPESRAYNQYSEFEVAEPQYQQEEIQPEYSYDFSARQSHKVPDGLQNRHVGSISVPRSNQFIRESPSTNQRGHSNTLTHNISKSLAFDSPTPQNNVSNSGVFKLFSGYNASDNLPEFSSPTVFASQTSALSHKNFDTLKSNSISRSQISPQRYTYNPTTERGGSFKTYIKDNPN